MPYKVTFETKCYENDWDVMLKTNRLENMIEAHSFSFSEKILYINNVANIDQVKRCADRKVAAGVISSYVVVEEYAQRALDFFDVDIKTLNRGYYYSIQELVGIFLCSTDYLLHHSSDSMMAARADWISSAIECMNANLDVVCATCTWNNKFDEVDDGARRRWGEYNLCEGFSDQMYLIPIGVFRDRLYNSVNAAVDVIFDKYAGYGGNSFERRVAAWLKEKKLLRAVHTKYSYVHRNISKCGVAKRLGILTGHYDKP